MARLGVGVSPLRLLSLVLLVVLPISAQITNVTNDQANPVPGVPHDYIKMLSETVNPANGSLSVRINIPLPQARGITLPFSFAYDSSGIYSPRPLIDSGGEAYLYAKPDGPLTSSKGWSYSVPMLSYVRTYKTIMTDPNIPHYATCYYDSDYVFYDPSGGRHSLYVAYVYANQSDCSVSQLNPAPVSILAGGDTYYSATFQNPGTWVVTDADGTSYKFSQDIIKPTPDPSKFGGPVDNWAGVQFRLPAIQDRNGNSPSVGPSMFTLPTTNNYAVTMTDTLGRQLVTSGFGVNGTIQVPGLNGSYSVTWGGAGASGVTVPATRYDSNPKCPTSFPSLSDLTVNVPMYPHPNNVITAITLPISSGGQYQFQYDTVYGLLKKIIYPSGGWVTYTWKLNTQSDALSSPDGDHPNQPGQQACRWIYATPAIDQRTVSFDGTTVALQQTFSYVTSGWVTSGPPQWSSKQTTVTTHDLKTGTSFDTVYVYSFSYAQYQPYEFSAAQQVPVEQSITYKNYSGTVLKTVKKTWTNPGPGTGPSLLRCELETLDNSVNTATLYAYGYGGVLTNKKEYDFLPSSTCPDDTVTPPTQVPLRETAITYQVFANPNILDRPSSAIVKNSGGTTVAETDYLYDQASVTPTTPAAIYHTSGINSGNATRKTAKCLAAGCQDAITTFAYDDTGQVLSIVAPNGNASGGTPAQYTTTYTYADNYTSGSPPGSTNAYLTKITYPSVNGVVLHKYFGYGYQDGQLTYAQDDNQFATGVQTGYQYVDNLARITEIDYPDAGKKSFIYTDTPLSPSVTSTVSVTPTITVGTIDQLDGLGHILHSQLTTDPDGADTTDSSFDGMGRPATRSNPHRSSASPTDGITTTNYDSLGRVCLVVPPGGATQSGCPAAAPAGDILKSYSGNCTTITDETGKTRMSCTDALGRLTKVVENPSGLNYETDYQYDLQNNLTCVAQKAADTSPFTTCAAALATWRPRSFVYDGLSRLSVATNPESGMVTYGYDANGNMISRVSPLHNQTGASMMTVTYTYDALNRLTSKSYSDGTATVKYGYDGVALSGCNAAPPALMDSNPKGYRTSICGSMDGVSWSHDIMGRALVQKRNLNGQTKTISYGYNLDGSIASITYPSGRAVSYSPGGAGLPLEVKDTANGINYVAAAHYTPSGALATMVNGYVSSSFNGISTANTYNKRLQPVLMSASSPTATLFSLCYDFHVGGGVNMAPCVFSGTSPADNGDVYQIVNNRDTNRTQNFSYDALNRIQQAYSSGPNWGEAFTIDAWGNLTNRATVAGKTNYEPLSAAPASTKNQLPGFGYDAAGNMTSNGSATYVYDGENRLKSAGGHNYIYDADGARIRNDGSSRILYWRGTSDDVLAETDSTAAILQEYIYFDGRRIARRDGTSNTVHYYFSDYLGSASVITDQTGSTIQEESDYYPYGGEIAIVNGDPNRYKFTGKERDAESGLDNFGARYDASNLARFMTPDPLLASAIPLTPQTWNRYAYARNNPLRFVDPDGLEEKQKNQDCSAGDGGDINCGHLPEKEGMAQNTYKSKDAAAEAAGREMRKKENGYKQEYGARIHKDGKKYSYGPVVTDKDPKGVNLPDLQKNDVGDIHTHNNGVDPQPNVMGQSDQQGTVRDMDAVRKMNGGAKADYSSYVLAPNGDLIKFTPDTSGPAGWGQPQVIKHDVAPDPNPQ